MKNQNPKNKPAIEPAKLPNFQKSCFYTHQIDLSDDERKKIIKSLERTEDGGWDRECLSQAHLEEMNSVLKLRNDLFVRIHLYPKDKGRAAQLVIRRKCHMIDAVPIPEKANKVMERLGNVFGLPTQMLVEKIVEYAVTLPNLKEIIERSINATEPLKMPQDARKSRGRVLGTSRQTEAIAARLHGTSLAGSMRRRTPVLAKI
jgi:hypothetical protein